MKYSQVGEIQLWLVCLSLRTQWSWVDLWRRTPLCVLLSPLTHAAARAQTAWYHSGRLSTAALGSQPHIDRDIYSKDLTKNLKKSGGRQRDGAGVLASLSLLQTESHAVRQWTRAMWLSAFHSHLPAFITLSLSLSFLLSPRRHNAPAGCQSQSRATGKRRRGWREAGGRGGRGGRDGGGGGEV